MDFSDLSMYNSELHRVVAQLRMCGEDVTEKELIDKTLSTFPPALSIFAQQYRNMRYATHASFMSYLLLAEKQHQVLIKNADAAPTKEVHAAEVSKRNRKIPRRGTSATMTSLKGPSQRTSAKGAQRKDAATPRAAHGDATRAQGTTQIGVHEAENATMTETDAMTAPTKCMLNYTLLYQNSNIGGVTSYVAKICLNILYKYFTYLTPKSWIFKQK